MANPTIDEIRTAAENGGPEEAVARLVSHLRQSGEYDRLFDALLLRKRFELGLPTARPTALDDVEGGPRDEFEKAYVEAAREVGQLHLDAGAIKSAWPYFKTIREFDPVHDALERLDPAKVDYEEVEELVGIALYEAVHPAKGVELMLATHGTCNAVTASDQAFGQLNDEDRAGVAKLLVRQLHGEVSTAVRAEIESKEGRPPEGRLSDWFAERGWLFENANYHTDVSHLNASVRFAQVLEPDVEEFAMVRELVEYGRHLAPQLQYAGEPPFQDFYNAYAAYYGAIADEDRASGVQYFRDRLDEEPDEPDKPGLAFVLVDLLMRCGEYDQALAAARPWLEGIEQPSGFSFAEVCRKAGRFDVLREVAEKNGDAIRYVAAICDGRTDD
ncbi:hypothetical protein [Stratiformator vulcanicus]|uniref:Tetratricopeptide repeat protein n=1 Tax=Stratiformator vulcanicus TaxID=2527980 RepID=A0A517R6I9_9PLAN|nr:hypothetical protein [Stratiformator vulcanicus]QDT39453.1 hypothetical protein Pan189_38610 [Stratiformator vulcanicus]